MAVVHIKKGEGRSFKAGGFWIYDNEIEKIEGEFENGDIVEVVDIFYTNTPGGVLRIEIQSAYADSAFYSIKFNTVI